MLLVPGAVCNGGVRRSQLHLLLFQSHPLLDLTVSEQFLLASAPENFSEKPTVDTARVLDLRALLAEYAPLPL